MALSVKRRRRYGAKAKKWGFGLKSNRGRKTGYKRLTRRRRINRRAFGGT